MKKSFIFLTAVVMAMSAFGAVLSPEQALSRLDKGALKVSPAGAFSPRPAQTVMADGSPALYVFNRTDTEGWLLVSANDETEPLWGYSESGSFSTEDMPPALVCYLNILASNAASASPMRASHANISPSLSEQWSQKAPFNQRAPFDNGTQCPTGCVSTAFAQIIHHNRYPSSGSGVASYEWSSPSGSSQTLTYTFTGHTFDFSNMINSYNGSYTSTQAAAVADLMYACGVSFKSTYKSTGTGSTILRAAKGLIENFNYDKGMWIEAKDWYTAAEWDNIVYNNIRDFGPTYMEASDNLGGHAFVLDGYNGGYYHINWGWGGSKDGYFLLASLNPYTSGSTGFIYNQLILCGLQKPHPDSVSLKKFVWTGPVSFETSGTSISLKSDTGHGCFNYSTTDIDNVNFGAEFVDSSGNSCYGEGKEVETVVAGSGYNNYMAEIPDLAPGVYTVYGACRYDGQWHRTGGCLGQPFSTTIEITDEDVAARNRLYLIGEPAGGWGADKGKEITGESGIFNLELDLSGASYFAFTQRLGADADDWNTLNAFRLGSAVSDPGNSTAYTIPGEGRYKMAKPCSVAWCLPKGKWALTIDTKEMTLTVENAYTDPEDYDIYLIGEPAGAWSPVTGTLLPKKGNVHTAELSLEKTTYFGFAKALGSNASDWATLNSNRFGPVSTDAAGSDTFSIPGEGQYPVAFPSSNSWNLPAGNWILSIDPKEKQLSVKMRTTSLTETRIDSAPRYFNLQGIPVANPAGGIFIRQQGSSVSKVFVP